MPGEITKEEYNQHKANCSTSFDDIFEKLNKMERAMFGERDLDRKGVYEMTTEMYNSIMVAKGGRTIFLAVVRIVGIFAALIAGVTAIYQLFKR